MKKNFENRSSVSDEVMTGYFLIKTAQKEFAWLEAGVSK